MIKKNNQINFNDLLSKIHTPTTSQHPAYNPLFTKLENENLFLKEYCSDLMQQYRKFKKYSQNLLFVLLISSIIFVFILCALYTSSKNSILIQNLENTLANDTLVKEKTKYQKLLEENHILRTENVDLKLAILIQHQLNLEQTKK